MRSHLAVLALAVTACRAAPRPVILSTDLGTDVDDAYALVLAANSPEVDLRAVVTLHGKPGVRAAIARKLVRLMGKPGVAVGAGSATTLEGRRTGWGGWEGKGFLNEEELADPAPSPGGADLIAEVISNSREKVILVAVGPLTDVAQVLERGPELRSKIERLVLMGGSVRPITVDGVVVRESLETNFHSDVAAAAAVLRSGIPITLAPADVTFLTKLLPEDFERLRASDALLARGLVAMTLDWGPRQRAAMKKLGVTTYYDDTHAMLHDPLAVATLVDPSVATLKRVRIRVEAEPGRIRTVPDPQGPIELDVVVDCDFRRLSKLVADRALVT